MSETTYFNIIKLLTNLEVDLPVRLDSPFKITAGLKPDVNVVTCSGADYERLAAKLKNPSSPRRLTDAVIAFYFNSEETADVRWSGMKIVDVEPAEIASSDDGLNLRVASYKIALADARWKFVFPRGGRLTDGAVNKFSIGQIPDPVPNSTLMRMCLKAMGITATVPAGVDDFEPLMDLDWSGAHAPTELARLLEHTQTIFVPTADGKFKLFALGDSAAGDGEIAIPTSQAMGMIDLPGVNSQSKTVVVTSAPTRVINTREMFAPDGDTWEFVAPEGNPPAWTPLEDLTTIKDLLQGPSNFIRTRFKDLPPEVIHRTGIWIYRAVRLNQELYPPGKCRVLRHVLTINGTQPITVLAKKASWDQGKWRTTGDWIPHEIIELLDGNVLTFQEHLGKVESPVGDLNGNFRPLEGQEIKIRFSVEEIDANKNPLYYVAAFQMVNGQMQKLSEDDARNALGGDDGGNVGDDVFVVHRPSLQLIQEDGEDQNRDELDAAAEAIAELILANSAEPTSIEMGKGFIAGELDGIVSEIRWDQQALHTTFVKRAWWKPSQALLNYDSGGGAEPFPKAGVTGASRSAAGNSSAGQPRVSAGSAYLPMEKPIVFPVKVQKVSGDDGNRTTPASWYYKVMDINSRVLSDSAALAIPRSPGKRIPGDGYGWACYGQEGDLVLLDAGERWVPC